MIDNFSNFITLSTLISNIALVIFLIFWYFMKKNEINVLIVWFKENGLRIAFLASLVAVASSLFYSDYALYLPCKLCWIQRIFMYPQVILLGIALWKQDLAVKKYSISLAVIGVLFAIYHYLTQRFPSLVSAGCSAGEADCTYKYGFDYGYITIPIMSLTIFLFIIVFVCIWQKKKISIDNLDK
ncbi:MAG: disulfide bond formation protein B [Candidatus Kerfeldbacteria bacterium]